VVSQLLFELLTKPEKPSASVWIETLTFAAVAAFAVAVTPTSAATESSAIPPLAS